MKRTLIALSLLAATLAGGADDTWTIDARSLAAPGGASNALRNAIAGAPAPAVAPRLAVNPKTAEEWRAIIGSMGQQIDLDALGKQAGVTIKADEIEGVAVYRVVPKDGARAPHEKHVFLYLHGGAYVFGGGPGSVTEAVTISARVGIPSVAVDYRMPPDHPFPAAVDDAVAVYRKLLDHHAPSQIAVGGTSAGGGLTLAAIHRMLALDMPVPGAAYLGTPWADLTDTSDTLHSLEGIDRILVTYQGMLAAAGRLYAGDEALTHPLISPVYGDFDGFPPTYLVTGTRDMLLSDTVRVHRKLKLAGVATDLNVYEGLSHAEYLIVADSPEHEQAYGELGAFLGTHLE